MSQTTSAPGASSATPDSGKRTHLLVVILGWLLSPVGGALRWLGDHTTLLLQATTWLFRRPFRPKLIVEQMDFVGVGSLPIILLVAFFSGAVTAQQAIRALEMFQQENWVGAMVGVSLAQELAPVFTGLMITARAGAGIATELGSMRITEQVDALTTFAVNPVQYLVTPRIVATVLMMPVMTMVFNVVGMLGAYLYAIVLRHIDYGQFREHFTYFVDPKDYAIGVIKSLFFGVSVSLTACYQGFFVRGGAKEVGLATTRAVVAGSVSIMVLDYFLIDSISLLWPSQVH